MAFLKVVKNKSYFSRYQVKYRRRREGKTNYARRYALVIQDKTKYAAHKYRLVVRLTNKDTICQIVYSKIQGDFVLAAAYAHELNNYGLSVGHTNYAAVYATGLLVARRVLKKLKLDTKYQGNKDINGEDYLVSPIDGESRPFKCFLDVGLRRTSTGSKVFAALKGATDGGLNIPHSVNRFVGYDTDGKKLVADTLRKYIFGGHVAEHMEELQEEDPESYQSLFARYIKEGLEADDLEDKYKEVHAAIRANPDPKPVQKKKTTGAPKKYNTKRLTYEERRKASSEKKAAIKASKGAAAESEEDDE